MFGIAKANVHHTSFTSFKSTFGTNTILISLTHQGRLGTKLNLIQMRKQHGSLCPYEDNAPLKGRNVIALPQQKPRVYSVLFLASQRKFIHSNHSKF